MRCAVCRCGRLVPWTHSLVRPIVCRLVPPALAASLADPQCVTSPRICRTKDGPEGLVDRDGGEPYHAMQPEWSVDPMTTTSPMLPRERCDYSAIVDRP